MTMLKSPEGLKFEAVGGLNRISRGSTKQADAQRGYLANMAANEGLANWSGILKSIPAMDAQKIIDKDNTNQMAEKALAKEANVR